MQLEQRGEDFGTLFSTATAFVSPLHHALTTSRLYEQVPALGLRPWPRHVVRRLTDLLLTWHERARQRRALSQLSDHMLADLGLSRADVEGEVAKPLWRL